MCVCRCTVCAVVLCGPCFEFTDTHHIHTSTSHQGGCGRRKSLVCEKGYVPVPVVVERGRRQPRETRRLREQIRTAHMLCSLVPAGSIIDAARAYAEEHDLEVSEPRLEPEAIARRDTELRRIAALVAAGAHVQLACTRACRVPCVSRLPPVSFYRTGYRLGWVCSGDVGWPADYLGGRIFQPLNLSQLDARAWAHRTQQTDQRSADGLQMGLQNP
jgi:hypothetical protein